MTITRGEPGFVPDAYHVAVAAKADEIRRDLTAVLERNPDLSPGLAGRPVTIVGKAGTLADIRWLEMLEDAWRPGDPKGRREEVDG